MRLKRTIVETVLPRVNVEGEPVDKNNRTQDPKAEEWVQASDKVRLYLLHWGLTYYVAYDKDNYPYAVSYTVGICQEIQTGRVVMISPDQLTVVEKEVI